VKTETKTTMQAPKKVVNVLLAAIVLSTGFLDYWAYSEAFYRQPKIWMDVVWGTGNAPNQYRIGVIDTAFFLARHLHVGMRHTLALLDVISGMIAVFALFMVLERSAVYRRASVVTQWFGAASFIVLVQFHMAWLLWYQRPETLPAAALLALTLLLIAGRSPGSGSGDAERVAATVWTIVGLLVLALAQGFVRADVAFALHLGILAVSLTSLGEGFALGRRVQAWTSAGAMLLVLGIQYYLIKKVFPEANYADTQIVQLLFNLKSPSGYAPFLLVLLPTGWTAAMLWRRRYIAGSAEIATFAGAAVFFVMWVMVGRIKEVRIFLPFALGLAPLTVEFAMQCFLPDGDFSPGERSETAAGVRAEATLPHS
jgi:hypothetical protein